MKYWPTTIIEYTQHGILIKTATDIQRIIFNIRIKVKYTLVQALRLCTGRTAYRGVEV